MTSWIGMWRNQFDSVIVIDDDRDGRVTGVFRTAIADSPFAGMDAPITGVWDGDAIAFVCSADGVGVVVSYTGKLEEGRLETLWIVLDGSAPWWKSAMTNHDTFERVED